MKITRDHTSEGCRYDYDFGPCSSRNGWAQIDTPRDASYYGTWAHPDRLQVFTYCEGDTTLVECESPEEFNTFIRSIRDARIDPGFDPAIRDRFVALGLEDLLH